VSTTRRSAKFAALAVCLAFTAAACGSDSNNTAATDAPGATTGDTAAPGATTPPPAATTGDTTAGTTGDTTAGAAGGMTVTYNLSDVAVWEDGTPYTAADFECTTNAIVNTPGSITTTGYDQIDTVTEGSSPQDVVVHFTAPFAAWKTLFNYLLEASQHSDCNDVSGDFATGAYTYGAGPYSMTSWSAEQVVYEKNAAYTGAHTGGPDRVVLVPAEDGPTLLKSGSVDFIYPQAYTGIDQELADPNVKFDAKPGGQFEALYFQQDPACTPDETRSCAFADADYRKAFSESIDLQGVYDQIYAPFANGVPLLDCGPIAPGPYCDPVFTDTYQPDDATATMTAAGWAKNADGLWAKDGKAPQVHWMVNTGNTRRESTQEYLIPLLKTAGFDVVADNCEATPCVFQTRLPAEKYDLGMYISTVAPDPIYITSSYVCEQIPSATNDFNGQNNSGWCNEEASSMLHEADATVDEAQRATLVKGAIKAMKDDYVLLPTLQFPNIGAYRSDKVSGTQNNLANYWGFKDWWNFKDLDGDGQVIIGAEQFPAPDCTNPVTECSNSSWFQWVAGFPNFPGVYDTTDDQTFAPSEYLTGEATVTLG
jgi:peptide/nickel transport system substrate-binding protein